jgi:hypothetical protein
VTLLASQEMRLSFLERNGEWTRVLWQSSDLAVVGWAESRSLRESDHWGSAIALVGCCVGGHPGLQRRVILPPGTSLHAGPSASPWAVVHTALEVAVEQEPGAAWAQVQELGDVVQSCALRDVWVDAADLR